MTEADLRRLWHEQGKLLATVSGVLLVAIAALAANDPNKKLVDAQAWWYMLSALLSGLSFILCIVLSTMFCAYAITAPFNEINSRTGLFNIYRLASNCSLFVGVLLFLSFALATYRPGA